MSYNGSGTFNINTTGQPVVAGTVISSSAFNALTTDLATGLTTAITKDGQTTTTARITFAQGITSSLVTDSSSISTGSIITGGGVGIAKALYVGTTANVAGAVTLGGIATFSAQPIFSSLTASSAVATDASKGLVSVTNTGTGNNVLATSPTITTPTISSLSSASATALTLQSAGTTGITVATNGSVGIGTASPSDVLTVAGNDAFIRVDRTANEPGIDLRVSGSTTNKGVIAVTTGGAMYFTTGGNTERMRINAGAPILCLAGGSTTATGTGIAFPATQSASSDANTLDDYEEGTFTPTASSSSGSLTSYTSSGRYIKIGQMVWVQCGISIVTSGTAGGSLSIGNFPFTYSGSNVNKNQLAGTVRETGQTGVYYGSFMNAGNNSITVQTLTAGAIVWTALYEYALYVCYQTT